MSSASRVLDEGVSGKPPARLTSADVRKALLLFLGAAEPSAKQVQRFANGYGADMLVKLLASDSLRGTTWSALIAGYDSPRRRDERLTVSEEDAHWAYSLLGLSRATRSGAPADAQPWARFLIEFFTDPDVADRLRAAGVDQGMLDQLAPLAAPSPMPHWCAFLHVVLLGRVHPMPFSGEMPTLAREAIAILASDAFREEVLIPLGDGGALPHERLWTSGPSWAIRAQAERILLTRGQCDLMSIGKAGGWARFLLRLLVHEDFLFPRLLAVDAEILGEPGDGTGVNGVGRGTGDLLANATAALRAARAGRALRDPVVGSRLFEAGSNEDITAALHRLCLMSEPIAAQIAASIDRPHDVVLKALVRTDLFRSSILKSLRSRSLPVATLDEAALARSVALLAPLFGYDDAAFPVADNSGARDAARRLLTSSGFVAVACSDPPATPAEAYVAEALAVLAALGSDASGAPGVRIDIQYGSDAVITLESDLAEERRATLIIGDTDHEAAVALLAAAAGRPASAALVVPIDAARRADGMFIGKVVLTGGTGAPIAIPIFETITEEALAQARAREVHELDRALAQAQRGTGDPTAMLEASIAGRTPRAEVLVALADIAAALGDREEAEGALARARPEDRHAPQIEIMRARLAMANGRHAEAVERYGEVARGSELTALDRTLHDAARHAAGEPETPNSFAEEPVPEWLARSLLLQVAAPEAELGWLPLGTKHLEPEVAEKIVARLIEAMSAIYPPPALLGQVIVAVQRSGLASPAALYAQAADERSAHRLLSALAYVRPESFNDVRLLITLARRSLRQNDHARALGFVQHALTRDPRHHEALVLAGAIFRQLKRFEEATSALWTAFSLKPDDERTIARLIELEGDALARDPLRSRERMAELQRLHAERAERRIFNQPTDIDARFAFARSCISLHRYDDAREVLEGLAADGSAGSRARSELLRIAVQTGDHEGALAIARDLLEEGFSARAVQAAVRALRALGRFEEAQALLQRHFDADNEMVRREYVRGHFYLAEFEEAAHHADEYLEHQPGDLDLRLLAAAAYLELGQTRPAGYHVYHAALNGGTEAYPLEMPLYLCALAGREGQFEASIKKLDPMFAELGVQGVRYDYDRSFGDKPFDQLVGAGTIDAGPATGPEPLVSVIMTTFNAQAYVGTAIRSILAQSHRNLELIIVDDASSDRTPAILQDFERRDPRVRAILKTTNDGTYVSKNIGLLQAQGEYIALQDCDDWSHPDRIAKSVDTLIQNPSLVGLTTDWIRMTTDGQVVIKGGGQIAHLCCISLVFRRVPVLRKVGSFDSVRIAADLEFIQRIGLSFGSHAVPRLRWPLLFGRARSDSLTASEEFGLSRTGFSPPRQAYHDASKLFHERIATGASPSIPFPLTERLFPAPGIILPRQPVE